MAVLPSDPFDIGGHLFYQCLPLLLLFSMRCPSPFLLDTYKFIGAPQLCQALPQPHIPGLSGGTSHTFGSVWVVSGPSGKCNCPLSPLPLSLLATSPQLHPIPLPLLRGKGDFGEPVPWCSLEHCSLLSILLLWCLLPSPCPTCSPGELACCLAPCPLFTDSLHLQNSFFLMDINFSPLFLFSLCLSHVLLSPQPYCSRKVSAFSPFLWLFWLCFCPFWCLLCCREPQLVVFVSSMN